jgi:putative acetyltransferase
VDAVVAPEPPGTEEVRALLAERDAYVDRLYAREARIPKPVDLDREDLAFFGVRVAGRLVGCGALLLRPTYGEVKRVYLSGGCRGRGLGRRLLEAIEAEAVRRRCRMLRLETGILQPEALGLYEALGYARTGPFGTYPDDPLSIFMEKPL